MIPAAVLIYVLDIKAGTRWYRQAFPEANLLCVGKTGPGVLDINGFSLEVVQADAKVSAGKQGTVLYWSVESLPETVSHLESPACIIHEPKLANMGHPESISLNRSPYRLRSVARHAPKGIGRDVTRLLVGEGLWCRIDSVLI